MSDSVLILGGGLAGLSVSYHLGHNRCQIIERESQPYGHIRSDCRDGFTWDQGPHVSFTSNEYVRRLFAESVDGSYEEYVISVLNYFQGHWIDHPAQSNLYQIPQPLRSQCLQSFLASRSNPTPTAPRNYGQWLDYALGPVFAKTFVAAYTRKYWTVTPEELGTDWIGKRVYYPTVEDIQQGAQGPLASPTHYITQVRYPTRGGYQSFAAKMSANANIELMHEVTQISLKEKWVIVRDASGREKRQTWQRLVNTLPLPEFIRRCQNVPSHVLAAADALNCSQLLLVNISVPHTAQFQGNWFYIYDETMLSTRINYTERLSPHNAPDQHTGIQVEVYAHPKKGFTETAEGIARKVIHECVDIGFINPNLLRPSKNAVLADLPGVTYYTRFIPYANVICDHDRTTALDIIYAWLETLGLQRERGDTHPLTDWGMGAERVQADVAMAGRFAQWKYFWSDDCVLRGRELAARM